MRAMLAALSDGNRTPAACVSGLFTGHALFPIRLCSQNVRYARGQHMILTNASKKTLALALAAGWLMVLLANQSSRADAAFQQWLASLWPEAQTLGVSRRTFETVTAGLEPDLSLPDLVVPGRSEAAPGQAEFVQT